MKKSETDREKAYRKIRRAIIFGELKPGEKVIERRLCDLLQMGRTPTREAMRKLESEGFLRAVPNRGSYVTKTSLKQMAEIAEVVVILEASTIEQAAKLITPVQAVQLEKLLGRVEAAAKSNLFERYAEEDFRLHEFFPLLTGNEFLAAEIRRMRNRLFLVRALTKALFDHVDEFLQDHRKIVDAVLDKRPSKASTAMRIHVRRAKEHFIQYLKENPWLM